MSENRILDMLGDIRAKMFEILSESGISLKDSGVTLHNSSTKETKKPIATVISSDGGTAKATNSISTSDSRNKEDITPIVDDIAMYGIEEKSFKVNMPKEEYTTKKDYYNFIKDRFNPYSFTYKISSQEEDDSMTQEDKLKCAKSIGFIADEYDLENDKVAKEFIFKTEDGLLNYNTENYTTVIAIALQEAIKKIEILESKITELELQ